MGQHEHAASDVPSVSAFHTHLGDCLGRPLLRPQELGEHTVFLGQIGIAVPHLAGVLFDLRGFCLVDPLDRGQSLLTRPEDCADRGDALAGQGTLQNLRHAGPAPADGGRTGVGRALVAGIQPAGIPLSPIQYLAVQGIQKRPAQLLRLRRRQSAQCRPEVRREGQGGTSRR